MTPPKRGNHDGDRTLLESHALSILPLSSFLDTSISKNVGAFIPDVILKDRTQKSDKTMVVGLCLWVVPSVSYILRVLLDLSVTPPKKRNDDFDRTFSESHALHFSHYPFLGQPLMVR